jgi:hypothetical protein
MTCAARHRQWLIAPRFVFDGGIPNRVSLKKMQNDKKRALPRTDSPVLLPVNVRLCAPIHIGGVRYAEIEQA